MTLEYDMITDDAQRKADEAGYDLRWEKGAVTARFPKANGKIGVITCPLETQMTLTQLDERLSGLDYFARRGMELMGVRETEQ